MPDHLEPLRRIGNHRLQRGVMLELGGQIDDLAVDTRGDQVLARNIAQQVANDSAMRHDSRLAAEFYGYLRRHLENESRHSGVQIEIKRI